MITSAGPYNAVGDVITYDIVVVNTGNVTIDNIVLTDANAVIPAGEENIGTLAPGASTTVAVTHAVTQADLDAGSVSNQATATGEDPAGDPVTDDSDDPSTADPDDPTDTDVVQTPELTVTKVITSAGPYNAIDDVITYDILVTNTGNVTVDNIVLTDANAVIPAGQENIGTLAPGASTTVMVTHAITLDDLDSGGVSNQATATGEDPTGNPVTDDSDDPGTPDSDDPTWAELTQSLAITITKRTRPGEYVQVGDVIVYDLVVTNTGNVTLSNIEISDDNADTGSLSPNRIAKLTPGESVNATATHTITQADVDAGYVYNQAEVTGQGPSGEPVRNDSHDPDPSDPDAPVDENCKDCTITPIQVKPAVALVVAVTNSGSGRNGAFIVGDEIEYRFTVTNTGNTTLSGFVLNDAKLGLEDVQVDETLAPGESFVRTFRYTITAADILAKQVVTSATVAAESPAGVAIEDVSGDDVTNDVPTLVLVAEGPETLDDEESTPQNTPVTVNVLDNDEEGSSELDPATVRLIDPETGELSEEVTIEGGGTYTVGADGTITFTPIREFYGKSIIRYVVSDVNGLQSDPATVTITVIQSQPTAADDVANGTFNGPVPIQLISNDQPDTAPLDPATVEIVAQPQHGTLQVNGDGTVTYTPNQYYTGPDEFTYRVMDANGNWTNVATVRITIAGFHIPNIITPNGDGQNDRFVIVGLSDYDNAEVLIFNRWGNEVYRSRNYQQDWTAQGIGEGTYYYMITLRKDGKETVHKGWVLIKRR
ncbi:gliding motility-associated C-terminal domain-containing protein [Parapedobacter deserti]|uniref:Gliding motility-associated C-terminal domain-containing protein n=1 Tax=Parapedobacter deserti TaxID=1912957 RepID=A0ABV7JG96_9SPHI